MSTETSLKLLHKNLVDEIAMFGEELRSIPLVQAVVTKIPALSVAQEKLATLPPIEVAAVKGDEALELALRHISNFYAKPFELDDPGRPSTKFTERLPGLVCFQADKPIELMLRGQRINQLKDEFSVLAKQLTSDPYERFELLRQLFPWLVYLQITRHLKIVDRPIKSAWFNWEHRYNVRNFSKQQAIEYVERRLDSDKFKVSATEERQAFVLALLERIKGQSESKRYSIRRPMKAVPVMKLNMLDKTPDEPSIRPWIAHSPCFALCQSAEIKILPLSNYEPKEPKPLSSRYKLLDASFNLCEKVDS